MPGNEAQILGARRLINALRIILADLFVGIILGAAFSSVLILLLSLIVFLFVGNIPNWDLIVRLWLLSSVFTIVPGLIGRARWVIAAAARARRDFGLSFGDLLDMHDKDRKDLFKQIAVRLKSAEKPTAITPHASAVRCSPRQRAPDSN